MTLGAATKRGTLVAALAVASFFSVVNVAARESAEPTSISVSDIVRFATIGDPIDDPLPLPGRAANMSPDGERYAVILRRGEPSRESRISEILVFKKGDLFNTARPEIIAHFESSSNHEPIQNLVWLEDSKSLLFLGAQDETPPQVFLVSPGRSPVQITSVAGGVSQFGSSPSGHIVAAVSDGETIGTEDRTCDKLGCRVTSDLLYYAGRGTRGASSITQITNRQTGEQREISPPETIQGNLDLCFNPLMSGLSPNGRYGLWNCILKTEAIPAEWESYAVDAELQKAVRQRNNLGLRTLILVDFQDNSSRPLLQSPRRWNEPRPVWAANGEWVILPRGLEPLNTSTAQVEGVLAVSTDTGAVVRLLDVPALAAASTASWSAKDAVLKVEVRGPDLLIAKCFAITEDRWVEAGAERCAADKKLASAPAPALVVEQSVNERPVLFAVQGKKKARLLDPNLWLDDKKIAEVESISWQLPNGDRWSGGLYYPAGYTPGQKYPLVVQTHGYNERRFSLGGGASRNFAAQAIAARGMFVLQIGEQFGVENQALNTKSEWPLVQNGYEAAITYLDSRNLINTDRVGIIGWSRTGPHVGYTLTHSDFRFRAAAFADSGDFGWWWYLASGAPSALDHIYGSPPIAEGLGAWLENAPTFNIDRVNAPMLMWNAGPVWGLWDWYVGLKRQGRPVEYWNLPKGKHDLVQVSQRTHMLQLFVDWFSFWLNEKERTHLIAENGETAAFLADQYGRWRNFKAQQEVLQAQPRRKLLKWRAKEKPSK